MARLVCEFALSLGVNAVHKSALLVTADCLSTVIRSVLCNL